MLRITRRLLSLILVLAMAASAGLSVFAEGEPDDGMTPPERKFYRTVLPYVFALSCAYVGVSDTEAVKTSDKMWDAMGWYTAYRYLETGTDYLTAREAAGFQEAVFPGGNLIDCPQRLIDCGFVAEDYLGGPIGDVYYFPYHIAFAEKLLDKTVELKAEYVGIRGIAAELAIKIPGETAVYKYDFVFRPNNVKVSKALKQYRPTYVIMKIDSSLPDTDIGADELNRANNLKALLGRRNSIRTTGESPDGITTTQYYLRGESPCMLAVTKHGDGSKSVSGIFRDFVYKKDASTSNRILAYSDPRGGTDYSADLGSKEMFSEDSLCIESKSGEELIYTSFALGEKGLGCIRYTIDPSTLLCMKTDRCLIFGYQDYSESGEATGVYNLMFDFERTSYEYGARIDDATYMGGWNQTLRTVTVIYKTPDADPANKYEYRISVPYNWEYLPIEAVENPGDVYLDAACQREYRYPGDYSDYTVYVALDG